MGKYFDIFRAMDDETDERWPAASGMMKIMLSQPANDEIACDQRGSVLGANSDMTSRRICELLAVHRQLPNIGKRINGRPSVKVFWREGRLAQGIKP